MSSNSQWSAHRAPDGRPYWYNTVTKQSVWEKPVGAADPPALAVSQSSGGSTDGTDNPNDAYWTEHRTAEGVPYYHNSKTKQTVWEKPKGFSAAATVKRTSSSSTTVPSTASASTTATTGANSNAGSSASSVTSATGGTAASFVDEVDRLLSAPSSVSTSSSSRHTQVRMEAVDQFKSLLQEHNIPSNATFEQAATAAVVRDPRWAALNSTTERRAAFARFLDEQRERERTQFFDQKKTEREQCVQALRERAESFHPDELADGDGSADSSGRAQDSGEPARIKDSDDQMRSKSCADEDKAVGDDGSRPRRRSRSPAGSPQGPKTGHSVLHGETAADRFAALGWDRVQKLMHDDPSFVAVDSDDDREFYFDAFKRETELAARERKASLVGRQTTALRQWLRDQSEFGPTTRWRTMFRLIREHPEFSQMDELDQARAFDAELRDLQERRSAEAKDEEAHEHAQERERRDAFRELLRELADVERTGGPLLTRRSVWTDFCKLPELATDPRYQAIQGQPGSHPAELFDDAVEHIDTEFRRQRRHLRDYLEAANFELTRHSFADLLALVKGTDDDDENQTDLAHGAEGHAIAKGSGKKSAADDLEGETTRAGSAPSLEQLRSKVPTARAALRMMFDNERVDWRARNRKDLLHKLGPDGEAVISGDWSASQVVDELLRREREGLVDPESDWEATESRHLAERAAVKFLRKLAPAVSSSGDEANGTSTVDVEGGKRKRPRSKSASPSRRRSSSPGHRKRSDGHKKRRSSSATRKEKKKHKKKHKKRRSESLSESQDSDGSAQSVSVDGAAAPQEEGRVRRGEASSRKRLKTVVPADESEEGEIR